MNHSDQLNPEGAEGWKPFIEEWKSSGISMAEYCRRKNLVYTRFQYWKDRIYQLEHGYGGQESTSPEVRLVRVPGPGMASPGSGFSISLPRSGAVISIKYKDLSIEVPESFNPSTLSILLQTVRSV